MSRRESLRTRFPPTTPELLDPLDPDGRLLLPESLRGIDEPFYVCFALVRTAVTPLRSYFRCGIENVGNLCEKSRPIMFLDLRLSKLDTIQYDNNHLRTVIYGIKLSCESLAAQLKV